MGRSVDYTYDPRTGQWVRNEVNTEDAQSNSNESRAVNSNEGESTENLVATNSNPNTSTGRAEQEYNEIEVNTLSGTLNYIVNEETIKLQAGDTVDLQGLGSNLSGKYYVKDVTREVSNNGYSHSATVIKTDFGDKMKRKGDPEAKNDKKVDSPQKSAERTYTVKKGDCLWSISKQFYGTGAEWEKIYNANQDKCGKPYVRGGTTYVMIYAGQVLTIP